MPTGTTFSRTVKPSVNYAVPPSSRILVPGPHNEELGAPVANPAERKGGTEMREKIKGTLGAIWCCCRPKSRTDFSKITGFIERHVNRSWVPRNLCRFLQLLSSLSFCNQHVCLNPSAVKHRQELWRRDLPGGTVVKNPPANAGYTGLSPVPERSHMPRSN
ncbi:uncharacterized protein LOC132514334 isoform X3 [Lagenorhynchus albirostris]|uniref:uncharacterized protein LOC132514334 isoform X3 n=1 Tax=Lagenorhynchus albirostris TaxID=27610 RepID=UPI0028E282A6|nr:uncharacterized protein LOC132514334 isoform X3 [Lagenorhynchus albirostris]XP_059994934.1 uncharacterized protein LOC132514334 isoform X3 [Lagenorhynchus albirostris]XP_059994935.1 uncharacterized protein LOC132514334 isoform X3 [Lagenorhynchus albirostris]